MEKVLRHIKTISVVEIKLLMRSFTVRFMWLLFLSITAFFVVIPHRGGYLLPRVPGAIAMKAYFWFSLVRLVLSSFIAPVFVHKDAKQDAFQSIHPRPFANTSYTIGKLIGFTGVMLVMDYFVMLILFVSRSLLPGMAISAWPYLLYPLIITLPLCVFLFGMNVFLARIFYPLVFIAPFITLMVFFPLEDLETQRVFDLGAITLPLAYSTITGFYNLTPIIVQRLIYLFGGIGFVLLSSFLMYFFRASGDRRMHIRIAGLTGLAFLFSLTFIFLNNKEIADILHQRQHVATVSRNYAPVCIESCDVTVTHTGKSVDVRSKLTITNPTDEPIDTIYLKHHISFETYQVTSGSQQIETFSNDVDAICIELTTPLRPDERLDIEIADAGSITQSGGYYHTPRDILNRVHRTDLTVLGKQYAFLESDYVLLPPEINWYPTSFTGYTLTEPGYLQRGLTEFTLTVTTGDGMVPISQGRMTELGDNTFRFEPEIPLTQISLTIGQYQNVSMAVDGIEYSYYWIGENPFAGIDVSTSTLEDAITSLKENIEQTLQIAYPFKRFQIVETPIHYFGYQSPYALSGPYEQPEIKFIPETSVNMKRYTAGSSVPVTESILSQQVFPPLYRTMLNGSRIMTKLNPPPSINLLSRLRQYMVDPFEDFSHLLTQFSVFSRGPVSTDDYFNMIAVHWLRTQFRIYESPFSVAGNFNNLDTAALQYLSSKSLVDILGDGSYQAEYMDILTMASETFFTLLAAKSGVDLVSLESVLLRGFASRDTDIAEELSELCGLDVTALFEEFAQQTGNAQYLITNQTIARYVVDERTLYNARFNVSNPTPYNGLFKCQIYENRELQDIEVIYMEPFTEKEVGLVSQEAFTDYTVQWLPFKSSVFTTYLVQQPRPANASAGFEVPDIPILVKRMEPDQIAFFDGVRDVRNGTVPPVVIMDNLDDGCRVVSAHKKTFLQRLVEKRRTDSPYLKTISIYNMQEPPNEWSLLNEGRGRQNYPFYGKLGCCYCITAGDGQSAVEYQMSIPESGNYAVYLSAPAGMNVQGHVRMMLDSGEIGETTVRIHAADGVHEEVVDISASKGTKEWVYVGSYSFTDTTAVVEITDKSHAKYVIADAVQLRKLEPQVSHLEP